jgi:AcrR family transcriptional regulator
MGLTGPALYRYFAGRDALLAELIGDAYDDLADALSAAPARESNPAERFRALSTAYREWGLAQPHRYRLLFGDPIGSGGVVGAARIIPASSRAMAAILTVLLELDAPPAPATSSELDAQLQRWTAERPGPDVPGPIARRGVLVWTRLHGVLSLEIEGHFAQMGFDPALLYAAEVETLLTARS